METTGVMRVETEEVTDTAGSDMRAEKARESRLRRAARRCGMSLCRSRTRSPDAADFGYYMLVDASTKGIVAGAECGWANLALDGVEQFLNEYAEGQTR